MVVTQRKTPGRAAETTTSYDATWLWYNATRHRHPGTNQKVVQPRALERLPRAVSAWVEIVGPPAMFAAGTGQVEDGESASSTAGAASLVKPAQSWALVVEWSDGSIDRYSSSFLKENDNSPRVLAAAVADANPSFLGLQKQLPEQNADVAVAAPPESSAPASIAGSSARLADARILNGLEETTRRQQQSIAQGVNRPIGRDDLPTFEYSSLVAYAPSSSSPAASQRAIYECLKAVNEHGLALVTGCPTANGSVLSIAEVIGHPMRTIYGMSWDVAVQPAPINIAYAPVGLDLHCDLVYYESPPGLQLLHCKVFDDDVIGGESTIVDGFYACEVLRKRDPAAFDVLTRVPATFEKVHYDRAEPVHMRSHKPHIDVRYPPSMPLASSASNGAIASRHRQSSSTLDQAVISSIAGVGVEAPTVAPAGPGPAGSAEAGDHRIVTGLYWAPPFEGVLRVHPSDVKPYYSAYRAFSRVLDDIEADKRLFIQFRMRPGDCIVFNNRRMLHGRREFFADGSISASQKENRSSNIIVDSSPSGSSAVVASGDSSSVGTGNAADIASKNGSDDQRKSGGRRVLEGCYVNIDEYKSTYSHLCTIYGRANTDIGDDDRGRTDGRGYRGDDDDDSGARSSSNGANPASCSRAGGVRRVGNGDVF